MKFGCVVIFGVLFFLSIANARLEETVGAGGGNGNVTLGKSDEAHWVSKIHCLVTTKAGTAILTGEAADKSCPPTRTKYARNSKGEVVKTALFEQVWCRPSLPVNGIATFTCPINSSGRVEYFTNEADCNRTCRTVIGPS